MADQLDLQFGRAAVKLAFIKPEQLAQCLQLQEESCRQGKAISLREIFISKGYLTDSQVTILMKESTAALAATRSGRETRKITPDAAGIPLTNKTQKLTNN